MNVIIIAAISLLVLVIISVLVLNAGGNLSRNTGCTGVQGQCVETALDCADLSGNWRYTTAYSCPDENRPACCIPMG